VPELLAAASARSLYDRLRTSYNYQSLPARRCAVGLADRGGPCDQDAIAEIRPAKCTGELIIDEDVFNTSIRKFLKSLRKTGYRYDISILQAEFSLTQVLDRPVHGRLFFEQVTRENLDLGRPQEVRLIFNRTITRRTPGQFRTRIVTQDVTPSLNVYYKNTRIKQYHKENKALRTETIINNSYDFGIGKRPHNLPKLREIGLRPIAGCSRSNV
jgi:hypothetical protein